MVIMDPRLNPGVDSRVNTFLKIGEIARLGEVGVDTVRYYERLGLLHAQGRSAGGYREFSRATVERIRFIKPAQSLGFRLDEMVSVLNAIDTEGVNYQRAHARLSAVAERIDAQIEDLRRVRSEISVLLAKYEADGCEELESTVTRMG
ncbi:MerR family transcriptional regulator [Variovorax gossypii]|nr:MerR family transcriptional regulator [Variovorax gossypii]